MLCLNFCDIALASCTFLNQLAGISEGKGASMPGDRGDRHDGKGESRLDEQPFDRDRGQLHRGRACRAELVINCVSGEMIKNPAGEKER